MKRASIPALYLGATLAIEAHVKDTARFPGGWAFFGFQGSELGKLFPITEPCYSCHEKNGAADTTFVQFYPTLLEIAKRKGTLKKE